MSSGLENASEIIPLEPLLLSSGLYRRPRNFTESCAGCALVGYHHRSGIGCCHPHLAPKKYFV